MILFSEGASKAQEDEANWILEALTVAYPGHPWAVRVYGDSTGGGFFIRHLDFPTNWGINCKHGGKIYSASSFKRDVISKAGEYLERANLMRGRWDETKIKHLEGVPERYQPGQKIDLSEASIVTAEQHGHRPEVVQAAEQIARSA